MKNKNVLNVETLMQHCSDIKKTISPNSLVLSSAMLLAGGIAFFLSVNLEDKSSSLYMAMVTSGIVLVAVALFRFFASTSHVVYSPTGSAIQADFCYFESDELHRVRTALDSGDFTQLNQINKKQGGNIRLDYLLSKDGNFIALQLFQYIPYTYEPVTEVISFRNNDSKTLSAYLKRK